MQLEDYFEFETTETKFGPAERIRIKGHRISIEHVIDLFNAGIPAEEIQRENYPSLTLEEVHATITYYLHNRAEVHAYMDRSRAIGDAFYQEYLKQEPSPAMQKIRALKARLSRSGNGSNG